MTPSALLVARVARFLDLLSEGRESAIAACPFSYTVAVTGPAGTREHVTVELLCVKDHPPESIGRGATAVEAMREAVRGAAGLSALLASRNPNDFPTHPRNLPMLRVAFVMLRIVVYLVIVAAAIGVVVGAFCALAPLDDVGILAPLGLVLAANFAAIWGMQEASVAIRRLETRIRERRTLTRAGLLPLILVALSLSACSIDAIAGVPVPRRPWCRVKVASAGNVDSPTQELGAAYVHVPCEAWHTDTIPGSR